MQPHSVQLSMTQPAVPKQVVSSRPSHRLPPSGVPPPAEPPPTDPPPLAEPPPAEPPPVAEPPPDEPPPAAEPPPVAEPPPDEPPPDEPPPTEPPPVADPPPVDPPPAAAPPPEPPSGPGGTAVPQARITRAGSSKSRAFMARTQSNACAHSRCSQHARFACGTLRILRREEREATPKSTRRDHATFSRGRRSSRFVRLAQARLPLRRGPEPSP